MKFLKSITLFAFLLCLSVGVQAQSKKKLKAEIDQLKAANTVLQQKVKALEEEKQNLAAQSTSLKAEAVRLKRDSATSATDYKILSSEYTTFKEKVIAERQKTGTDGDDGSITDVILGDSNKPCVQRQKKLEAGYSYDAKTLQRIPTKGYGVQVYSYSSLCNAEEKANEFMNYYRMYKTYIKVKMVGNSKVFSVVYGSLKDADQARTYTNLFKKNARVKERQGAFMVQHQD